MALTNGPNLGLLVNGNAGEGHYSELMKQWRGLDGLVMPNAKGYLTNTPPGSPSDGDLYIIGAAPTGAWAGQGGKVTRWSSVASAWEFYTPKNGWMVQSNSAREAYRHTAGAWEIFYQDGTFTPVIYGTTEAGTNTYSDQVGIFTRVGGRVDLLIRCTIDTIDTLMSGAARIGGLPLSNASTVACNVFAYSLAAGVDHVGATIQTSATYVGLWKNAPSSGAASMQATDMKNGSTIRVTSVMFI